MKSVFSLVVLIALSQLACGQDLGPGTLPEQAREGTSSDTPTNEDQEEEPQGEPLTPPPPGDAPGEENGPEPEPQEQEQEPEDEPQESEEVQGSALFLENQSCVEWTDCGPHFADPNSGAECVNSQCVCDPTGQYADNCTLLNGFFIDEECLCIITDITPPEPSEPDCYPHWLDEYDCQDRYWVDTSYYEEECYYQNGQEYCDERYVDDGYWVTEGCEAGRWIERCTG